VGHHQPKDSVKAFKEYREISLEGKQGCLFLGMLLTSTFAESLEVSQKTRVVHTRLTPPVNNILTVRRHQIIPLPFVRWALTANVVDIFSAVRRVWLIDQKDA
jgi:hypothetical protein